MCAAQSDLHRLLVARLAENRRQRNLVAVHASTLDRQLKSQIAEVIRVDIGAAHHLVNQALKKREGVTGDARTNHLLLNARVLQPVNDAAKGRVITVSIPRPIVRKPCVTKLVQHHPNKLGQLLAGHLLVVVNVGKPKQRIDHAGVTENLKLN